MWTWSLQEFHRSKVVGLQQHEVEHFAELGWFGLVYGCLYTQVSVFEFRVRHLVPSLDPYPSILAIKMPCLVGWCRVSSGRWGLGQTQLIDIVWKGRMHKPVIAGRYSPVSSTCCWILLMCWLYIVPTPQYPQNSSDCCCLMPQVANLRLRAQLQRVHSSEQRSKNRRVGRGRWIPGLQLSSII